MRGALENFEGSTTPAPSAQLQEGFFDGQLLTFADMSLKQSDGGDI